MAKTTFTWYGDEKKRKANVGVVKGITRGINMVDADAKLICPVKDGDLRNSLEKNVYPDKLIATEGTNLDYAAPVFLGTAHQAAQPTLRPALIKNSKNIISVTGKEVGREIGS